LSETCAKDSPRIYRWIVSRVGLPAPCITCQWSALTHEKCPRSRVVASPENARAAACRPGVRQQRSYLHPNGADDESAQGCDESDSAAVSVRVEEGQGGEAGRVVRADRLASLSRPQGAALRVEAETCCAQTHGWSTGVRPDTLPGSERLAPCWDVPTPAGKPPLTSAPAQTHGPHRQVVGPPPLPTYPAGPVCGVLFTSVCRRVLAPGLAELNPRLPIALDDRSDLARARQ
jgi:hypothetical protein